MNEIVQGVEKVGSVKREIWQQGKQISECNDWILNDRVLIWRALKALTKETQGKP